MNVNRKLEIVRLKRAARNDASGKALRIPYALCKDAGIDTTGMTPSEAWEAYMKATGGAVKPGDVFDKKKATPKKKEAKKEEPKKPEVPKEPEVPKDVVPKDVPKDVPKKNQSQRKLNPRIWENTLRLWLVRSRISLMIFLLGQRL